MAAVHHFIAFLRGRKCQHVAEDRGPGSEKPAVDAEELVLGLEYEVAVVEPDLLGLSAFFWSYWLDRLVVHSHLDLYVPLGGCLYLNVV